jgi:hypothetical protein
MASAERQPLHTRDSQTQRRRSPGVNLGRFLAERCSTPIWWRNARFSIWRIARGRKIEDKVAKRVTKEMNIGGEDYDSSIIPAPQTFRGFRKAQIKNARNLMYALYERGEINPAEYWAWKKKAGKIE